MSSRGRKRATPDEGVNFALERLRDGQDGRAGSLSNVIARVSALERAMKAGAGSRRTLEDVALSKEYREVEDRERHTR